MIIRHAATVVGALALVVAFDPFVAASVVAVPTASPAEQEATARIDGMWELDIVTGTNVVSGRLELQQSGDALTGTWTRRGDTEVGSKPVSGKVLQETLTFRFVVEVSDVLDEVAFVGELGEGSAVRMMAGTFTAADGSTGEWTARKTRP